MGRNQRPILFPPPAMKRPRLAPLLRLIMLLGLSALACRANPFRSEPEPTPVPTAPAAQIPAAIPTPAPVGRSFTEAVPEDADLFNPLLTTNATSLDVIGKILPRLVGQDPVSGLPVPSELAETWLWSPDGRTITFTLRSGVTWSDGVVVTSRDVGFTYAALASPDVRSPLAALAAPLESIALPDARTLVVTLAAPDCSALQSLQLPVLPSHLFAAGFADIATNPFNTAPTVGAGPFLFAGREPGARIDLVRNEGYWKGAPAIERYSLLVIPDAIQRAARAGDGSVDLAMEVPGDRTIVSAGPSRTIALLRDGYSMLVMNLADPRAPEPGQDLAGALLAQTPHPVLGDARVRQALAQGLNIPQIVAEVYGADAAPLLSYVLPTIPWAFESLAPYPYDLGAARQLLDDAGWTDADGNGYRERGDQRLQLAMLTNNDNPRRVTLGERLTRALQDLGVDVRFDALPFDAASEAVLEQRYDLAIVGYEGLGADPGPLEFWHSRADVPGSGLNLSSSQSAAVDRLLDEARSIPGCDMGQRGVRYRAVQQRIHEDVPALLLSGQLEHIAIPTDWQNVLPQPWSIDYNVETWAPAQ